MAKWERQRGESYPAFEAFQTYLEERTYPKVARRLSKSLTLIKRWAKKHLLLITMILLEKFFSVNVDFAKFGQVVYD